MDHIQSHLHIVLIISKYVIMDYMSFYSNREFNILWIFSEILKKRVKWIPLESLDSQYINRGLKGI